MKKILIFILILAGFTASAQVPLAGYITTLSGSYPTHLDSLGMGGYMTTYNKTTRNAIPSTRRKIGMMVRYSSADSIFVLSGGITNSNWQEFVTSTLVTDATISTSDITTNDASTSKHGFMPKLSGVATEFANGIGTYTALTSDFLGNYADIASLPIPGNNNLHFANVGGDYGNPELYAWQYYDDVGTATYAWLPAAKNIANSNLIATSSHTTNIGDNGLGIQGNHAYIGLNGSSGVLELYGEPLILHSGATIQVQYNNLKLYGDASGPGIANIGDISNLTEERGYAWPDASGIIPLTVNGVGASTTGDIIVPLDYLGLYSDKTELDAVTYPIDDNLHLTAVNGADGMPMPYTWSYNPDLDDYIWNPLNTEYSNVFTDNTYNNTSTSQHGLMPKLSGVSTEFANGTGGYSVPIASGSAGGDLTGTYPNPTINTINSITKSYYDPTSSIQTQLNSKSTLLTTTVATTTPLTASALRDQRFICDITGSTVVITLPSSPSVGDIIRITGYGSGASGVSWKVAQNSLTQIHTNSGSTTFGTSGYIEATAQYDGMEIVCVSAISGTNHWVLQSQIGILTIN